MKTLEDFKEYNEGNVIDEFPDGTLKEDFVDKKSLKLDAIKDIKYLLNFEDDGKMWEGETTTKHIEIRKKIVEYIKLKYDIIEEDLK